jgi:hypothetical protein
MTSIIHLFICLWQKNVLFLLVDVSETLGMLGPGKNLPSHDGKTKYKTTLQWRRH